MIGLFNVSLSFNF